jgi:hypothetical protein
MIIRLAIRISIRHKKLPGSYSAQNKFLDKYRFYQCKGNREIHSISLLASPESGDHAMRNFGSTTQDEISSMETAPDRKVVQISTMVHAEKDWAFVALCDDGTLWLYHGSWSQIENIPQTTDI